MENGFISREIDGTKHYGIDIFAEFLNSNGASSVSFPIQIKNAKRGQITRKKMPITSHYNSRLLDWGIYVIIDPIMG